MSVQSVPLPGYVAITKQTLGARGCGVDTANSGVYIAGMLKHMSKYTIDGIPH